MKGQHARVSGQTVDATVDNLMTVFRDRVREELAEKGIDEFDENDWYPVTEFARTLELIEDRAGEPTVRQLGAAVAKQLEWRDESETPAEALRNLPNGLQSCHRGRVGEFEFEGTDDGGTIAFESPYPREFSKGIVMGTVERFGGQFPNLVESTTTGRVDSDEMCEYEIEW
ncbi:hypothetical protein [Natronobacterium gregoryi]|uniref:Uncharacterized protein n=2 Tax=Natronobacterium gregoryi TaxID=44930 RepID=L0AMS4_NATGS|nr:hypothetical protein [Natronobacterium gregoryi]AFZ74764.1 hypothetical protein Natgr_3654 [Natronobacterium gregoryi SP2]ELY73565.1 hypothetical protein C490_01155 [Natronobacterium gregoryi SP2]PLK19407.1 hypothetical protein CYV19_14940 [Natronobacterium gregoryi SP2]SFJ49619.1 hypothetical protein SAMN05443661_13424 [Natronobacterium gregoryi]